MKEKVLMRFVVTLLLLGVCTQAQPVKPYLRIETGAHTGSASRIAVDAAERFMISVSDDKTARVWNLRTGSLLKILRPPIGDSDEGMLYAVAVSPDGTTVAVGGFTGANGSRDHPIYIFDRESGAIVQTVHGLPEVVNHLAYSRDGRYLGAAFAGKDGIRIFEARSYVETARDTDYGGSSYRIDFDESGRLATVSDDGFVRLYSPQFRLLQKKRPQSGKDPVAARFSRDGKRLAVGFHDAAAVDVLSADDLSFQYSLQAPRSGGNLASVLWLADGTVCAAGRYNKDRMHQLICWADNKSRSPRVFPVAGETIMDILALRDGSVAFSAADGSVGVVDRDGSARWQASRSTLDFRSLHNQSPRLSPDGGTIEAAVWLTESYFRYSVSERTLDTNPRDESSLRAPATKGLPIESWEDSTDPTLDGRTIKLREYETSRCLVISPKKDSFILGTSWNLRKFDAQGSQIWITSIQQTAWGVNISADQRYVVATLGDGTIRWYTFDEGKEVLALFVDRDLRRWVAWNPDGFFTFENSGDALIGYHINRGHDHEGEFLKVDQLRDTFYQPDLIAQILKPGGAEAVVAARERIGDIAGVLSGGLPPEIELVSPASAEVTDDYLLQFRIRDKGGSHGRVVYRIDGAEIEGRGAVDIRGSGADTVNRRIPIASGSHTLTVTVYSANNKIEGQPKTIQLTRRQPALGPSLYVIAAGVSHYSDHSLWDGVKFASADADLVATRFKEQEGRGLYRKVTTISLPDAKATSANLKAEVAKAAQAVQPGDIFILYLAGHGVTVDGEYYFIPWEAEYTNREAWLGKSLNREAIQGLLKQIPTNKSVLILDTCNAGSFMEGRSGPGEKAAIEKVALMSGRAVLAASNSDQMAMDGYQNHGVFTYVLLEGLRQAESNAQGEILISRLAEFVQSHVPSITDEKWHYRQLPLSKIEGEPFPIAIKPAN
jgi:WD40 repeat protein